MKKLRKYAKICENATQPVYDGPYDDAKPKKAAQASEGAWRAGAANDMFTKVFKGGCLGVS